MYYLLLVVLSIIVYAEILPTVSVGFELLRTWIASKIAIIQLQTTQIQEVIQEIQSKMEPQQTHAIGFQVPSESEDYYEEN